MLVNLAHRVGDALVVEQIDEPVDFEGSGAQEGVLVTFPLNGREVTGRIVKVIAPSADDPTAEPVIEIELVDRERLDVESEVTLANLPPKTEFSTEL
jgi:hypothetical protein